MNTHSVIVNNLNEAYFLRTVTFTSDTEADTYQTYFYRYNTLQQHITSSLIETSAIEPTTPPVEFMFTTSNNHVVSFDENNNSINVTASPFTPFSNEGAYFIELSDTRLDGSSISLTTYGVLLANISSDWTLLTTTSYPGVTFPVDPNDFQTFTLTVNWLSANTLNSGVNPTDIYIYDATNQTSARIQVELTVQ